MNRRAPNPLARKLGLGLALVVSWLARHWLWAANLFSLAYLGFAFLAPVLMATGHGLAGRAIYAAYSPLCHQWPDRSYFLFGPKVLYSLAELHSWLGTEVTRHYVGEPALGYKVAICIISKPYSSSYGVCNDGNPIVFIIGKFNIPAHCISNFCKIFT